MNTAQEVAQLLDKIKIGRSVFRCLACAPVVLIRSSYIRGRLVTRKLDPDNASSSWRILEARTRSAFKITK